MQTPIETVSEIKDEIDAIRQANASLLSSADSEHDKPEDLLRDILAEGDFLNGDDLAANRSVKVAGSILNALLKLLRKKEVRAPGYFSMFFDALRLKKGQKGYNKLLKNIACLLVYSDQALPPFDSDMLQDIYDACTDTPDLASAFLQRLYVDQNNHAQVVALVCGYAAEEKEKCLSFLLGIHGQQSEQKTEQLHAQESKQALVEVILDAYQSVEEVYSERECETIAACFSAFPASDRVARSIFEPPKRSGFLGLFGIRGKSRFERLNTKSRSMVLDALRNQDFSRVIVREGYYKQWTSSEDLANLAAVTNSKEVVERALETGGFLGRFFGWDYPGDHLTFDLLIKHLKACPEMAEKIFEKLSDEKFKNDWKNFLTNQNFDNAISACQLLRLNEHLYKLSEEARRYVRLLNLISAYLNLPEDNAAEKEHASHLLDEDYQPEPNPSHLALDRGVQVTRMLLEKEIIRSILKIRDDQFLQAINSGLEIDVRLKNIRKSIKKNEKINRYISSTQSHTQAKIPITSPRVLPAMSNSHWTLLPKPRKEGESASSTPSASTTPQHVAYLSTSPS